MLLLDRAAGVANAGWSVVVGGIRSVWLVALMMELGFFVLFCPRRWKEMR